MPGRNYTDGTSYRYGYQNQEQDPELWNGAVSFKYRMEDPRLGRFFSVDPLARSFPWNSPYAFAENRVISALELEGLEAWDLNSSTGDGSVNNNAGVQGPQPSSGGMSSTVYGPYANQASAVDGALNGAPVYLSNVDINSSSAGVAPTESSDDIPFIRPYAEVNGSFYKGGGGVRIADLGIQVHVMREDILGTSINSDDIYREYNKSGKTDFWDKLEDGFKNGEKLTNLSNSDGKTGFFVGVAAIGVGFDMITARTNNQTQIQVPNQYNIKVGFYEFFSADVNWDDNGWKNASISADIGVNLGLFVGGEANAKAGLRVGPR